MACFDSHSKLAAMLPTVVVQGLTALLALWPSTSRTVPALSRFVISFIFIPRGSQAASLLDFAFLSLFGVSVLPSISLVGTVRIVVMYD